MTCDVQGALSHRASGRFRDRHPQAQGAAWGAHSTDGTKLPIETTAELVFKTEERVTYVKP